jgi:hypothetical protein
LDLFSGGLQGGFDQGGGEAFLPRAGLGEVGLEAVAEGHQFVDFGDDAVLFGEGRRSECSLAKRAQHLYGCAPEHLHYVFKDAKSIGFQEEIQKRMRNLYLRCR